MRSVNVAELKNRLRKYLTFAKGGEEIVIRDRNLPVAKLVPFPADDGSEEELLLLVAAGKMRLPKMRSTANGSTWTSTACQGRFPNCRGGRRRRDGSLGSGRSLQET